MERSLLRMRLRKPKGVLVAELDGDAVLLNPDTGMYHMLNPSGRRLLNSFDAGASLDQAIEELASDASVGPDQVRADSESFVRSMIDRGLLEEER
jgi:hypothetical protein